MNNKAIYKLTYGLFVLSAFTKGKHNGCIINTAAQVTSSPNRISIAVNKANLTHDIIMETGLFNVSVISEEAQFKLFERFGFQSGRDVDKFKEMNLTKLPGQKVKAPLIAESPVNIECKVTQSVKLGTHVMFLATVEAVTVDDAYMDEKNTFHLNQADPIVYSHGEYYTLDKMIGKFGYSVRKKKK